MVIFASILILNNVIPMNRTKLLFIVFNVAVIIGLITFFGCQSGTQTEPTKDTQTTEELDKKSIEQEVENLVTHLPTPFEFAQMLNDIGARYVEEVLNSPENIDRYFTERQKAMILGVYGADLGYSSVYERTQQTNEYLNAIKTLLDDLKVDVDYSFMVNEEQRQRLNNQDTLVQVLTNTFYDVYEFLNQQNSSELTALMAAGTWIEGLYIATHISEDTYNNVDMVKLIYEQGQSLEQLLQLMEKFKDNPAVSELYTNLQDLHTAYKNTDESLTKEELQSITLKIEEIRSDVVS
jgi:hypothetical protein